MQIGESMGFNILLNVSRLWQVLISGGSLFQRSGAAQENALPSYVTCSICGISRNTKSADHRCQIGLHTVIKPLSYLGARLFKLLKVINSMLKAIFFFDRKSMKVNQFRSITVRLVFTSYQCCSECCCLLSNALGRTNNNEVQQ